MRSILFTFICLVASIQLYAQAGDESFGSLRYPNSSKANALGGHTVALIELDPSLAFHNPALFGQESDGAISLSYLNYFSTINTGSAIFTKALKERAAWGIGAAFVNYGSIKETTSENVILGDASLNDVHLQGFFSYDLSNRWRGGLSMKFLYSSLAGYTSMGLAVDAGLSYFNGDNDFSFGVTLKNIGAQLKAYDEKRAKLPWDIQLGISKIMKFAPLRLSITAVHLNKWKFNYINEANAIPDLNNSFFQNFFKHLIFGIDYVGSDNFWVGIGFNPKANMDMKIQNGNKLGGFSAGAGVRISKFDVTASYARYHPSANSIMVSISTAIPEFRSKTQTESRSE